LSSTCLRSPSTPRRSPGKTPRTLAAPLLSARWRRRTARTPWRFAVPAPCREARPNAFGLASPFPGRSGRVAAHARLLHAPERERPGALHQIPPTQVPFEQCVNTKQTFPQCPQLFELVLRLVSQPSAGLPLQSPQPALQNQPQLPLLQKAVALAGAEQMWP